MSETPENYDIPIRIDQPLVDGALLAKSLMKSMPAAQLLKLQEMLEKPTICKGDAKSTFALLASVGLMFVSVIEEAEKVHAARNAAGEPIQIDNAENGSR